MVRTRITTTGLIPLLLFIAIQGYAASDPSPAECRDSLSTRAHLTRCDKYFQCVVLPSKRIIWVSKQCDEGLVYDNDQRQCVVPDQEWECNLGEDSSTTDDPDDQAITAHHNNVRSNEEENIYGVNNFEDYFGRSDESSGAGEEEGEAEETRSNESVTQEVSLEQLTSADPEYSGDGTETTLLMQSDSSTEAVEMPITPDRDGTVKSYLQRLTQLIDGFRKNGGSTATEITPDQLNSFVVMHKIKSNKNYDPTGTHLLPENGNILQNHLDYILQKQYSLNTVESADSPSKIMTTTTTTTTTPSPIRRRIIHIIRPYHQPEPEDNTRILVKSQLGNKGSNETGYGSNSQIVVNRPEGSVLFNIARPESDNKPNFNPNREPSISQDTLKTVLELSKQLVSHQKYLSQKPNYLAPVVQPVYYAMPMPMMQSGSHQEYFHGEAVPVRNETTPRPTKIRPVKNAEQNSYYGQYQEIPQHQNYNRPTKYSSEEEANNNYTPQRPLNPSYQGQYQNNYPQPPHYNSNNPNKKPFGYYNSGLNGWNTEIYTSNNQHLQSQQDNNPHDQYYNTNQHPMTHNPHLPPYYDASGLGQSGENFYNRPQNNYQNYHQNNYNPYSPPHPQSDEYENEDNDSESEGQEEVSNETSATTEKPVKAPSSSEEKPVTSLSNLQLLSQQLLNNPGNKNKVVGINGNYMSYDTYKDTILPILNTDIEGPSSNLEVVSCIAGVRHGNSSDCTRYYVCNPKDGNLLGYTCPPYTAFNEMTRICDANSYALCKPSLVNTRFTIQENKRLQYEAQKTLQEAKRVRDQALQAQFNTIKTQQVELTQHQLLDTPVRRPLVHKIKQKLTGKKPQRQTLSATGTASKPPSLLQSIVNHSPKRRYKCTDPGQAIPDVLSIHKYFICFRDTQGRFKRRSMSCSKGLMFCRKRRMCTLKARC